MDIKSVRAQFPAVESYNYINTAEGGPISLTAAAAAKKYYDRSIEEGDLGWFGWVDQVDVVRKQVATFLHVKPETVGFCASVSSGMNLLSQLFPHHEGVLGMSNEFPSAILPWIHRGHEMQFVETCKDGSIAIEDIERQISPKTRVLVTSHVSYCTGFRHSLHALSELCSKKNLVLIIDATQSAGAVDLQLSEIKFGAVLFSCYKWMNAGYGSAVLVVNPDLLLDYTPTFAGWWSVVDAYSMNNQQIILRRGAGAFELGQPTFAPIFALGGAVELMLNIGLEPIYDRVNTLNLYMRKSLLNAGLTILSPVVSDADGSNNCAGITMLEIEKPKLTVEELLKRKTYVSSRGKGVRLSPHYYNNEDDIDGLVTLLQSMS